MFTLSDITRRVARLVFPDMMASGTATGGTTTTLVTSMTYADQYFDKGTIWILSGTHAGKILFVTGHRGGTLTFSETLGSAISAGVRFVAARAVYPFEQMRQAVQTALDDTYIMDEDATLEGDGETLEFTLPAGVYRVKEVWIENPDDNSDNYKSAHWKERNGKLRFDYGYAPEDGYTIRVRFRTEHAELVDYDDEIDGQINLMWLRYTAARHLLDWGMGIYKAQAEYRIEERMQLVLAQLEKLSARIDAPDLTIHSGD